MSKSRGIRKVKFDLTSRDLLDNPELLELVARALEQKGIELNVYVHTNDGPIDIPPHSAVVDSALVDKTASDALNEAQIESARCRREAGIPPDETFSIPQSQVDRQREEIKKWAGPLLSAGWKILVKALTMHLWP